jgi:hypothetical protein
MEAHVIDTRQMSCPVGGPAWATEWSRQMISGLGIPVLDWEAPLVETAAVTVYRTRSDMCDAATGVAVAGPERAQVFVGANALDETGWEQDWTASPEQLRAIGAALVAAADRWEAE